MAAECLKIVVVTRVGCQLSPVGGVEGLALRCCLGLGLALGFGVGGGVASERARVCGICSASSMSGQIQH